MQVARSMLPLFSAIQAVLPYLLALWLAPFVILAVKMARRPTADRLEDFPYAKNGALFSPAERSLLRVLEEAAGEKYRVLAKVQAAEIVSVRLMSDQSAFFRAVEQISARSFDFVLCEKDYLSIACAIKLDDGSRASQQDHEPDTFLEDVCKAISLPLVHLIAPDDLSAGEVRKKIETALHQGLETTAGHLEQSVSAGLATAPAVMAENLGQCQVRRTL